MINPNARARLIARINPAKLRVQAAKILEHPDPHPTNVSLAAMALQMAKFADGEVSAETLDRATLKRQPGERSSANETTRPITSR